jgi:5-formyltetrahydrofolate cyclo-ligase
MTDQQALRQHLRRLRAGLSARERVAAAEQAARHVAAHRRFRHAGRIAGYFGSKGELDPMPLLERAVRMHKECYLPVLHPFRAGRLWFCRWEPGDRLVPNRFDIPEPVVRKDRLVAARALDLIIVPLVAFDSACHRLGMGGGYYDRSLAFVNRLEHARRPFLLGFAHEIQHVDHLPTRPWDIRLDAVATQRRLYCA